MIKVIHFSYFQAKIKKNSKEEYLEDTVVFFPARGRDDEEAVGIVTHGIL